MINTFKIMNLIAQQEGYKFVDLNDNPHGAVVKGPNIAVMNKEGVTIGYGWNYDNAQKALPQWLDDVNAAFSLLQDMKDWTIEREDTADPYLCVINPQSSREKSGRCCTTLAYAIVDAYLTYYEINEDWHE